MNTRGIFAAIYLLVDIAYVATSKGAYEDVVRRIQGNGFPRLTASRILGAIASYAALVAGWYLYAAPMALALAARYPAWIAGMMAGAMYGFVVYAVFNGTLHAMFESYDARIALRDLLWGTGWATVLTALFAIAVTKRNKA